MRMILNATFDNSDLPLADPIFGLIRPSMLAGYDMLSVTDFSGNNRHMTYAGDFGAEGAVLTGDAADYMILPVPELAGGMTIITCFNMINDATRRMLFNNCDVGGSPYTGVRAWFQSGPGQFDVANTGTTFASASQNMAGAWTSRAFRWNATSGNVMNRGGTIASAGSSLTHTLSARGAFYVGGAPVGIPNLGNNNNPLSGTLGMMMIYNEVIADATVQQLMGYMAEVMAARGVTLP